MEFLEFLTALGVALKSLGTPIILGSATLLALVSTRNQHISDRARAVVKEALEKSELRSAYNQRS